MRARAARALQGMGAQTASLLGVSSDPQLTDHGSSYLCLQGLRVEATLRRTISTESFGIFRRSNLETLPHRDDKGSVRLGLHPAHGLCSHPTVRWRQPSHQRVTRATSWDVD